MRFKKIVKAKNFVQKLEKLEKELNDGLKSAQSIPYGQLLLHKVLRARLAAQTFELKTELKQADIESYYKSISDSFLSIFGDEVYAGDVQHLTKAYHLNHCTDIEEDKKKLLASELVSNAVKLLEPFTAAGVRPPQSILLQLTCGPISAYLLRSDELSIDSKSEFFGAVARAYKLEDVHMYDFRTMSEGLQAMYRLQLKIKECKDDPARQEELD